MTFENRLYKTLLAFLILEPQACVIRIPDQTGYATPCRHLVGAQFGAREPPKRKGPGKRMK